MAQYTINFSSNAPEAIQEIDRLIGKISTVSKVGSRVTLDIDTFRFANALDNTFRQLDRQISKLETRLSKLKIGGRGFQQVATNLGVVEGVRQRGTMQAQAIRLGAQAEAFDAGSAAQLRRQLESARISASMIAPNTPEWVELQRVIGGINLELRKADQLAEAVQMRENLGAFAPGSLAQLETKLTLLKNKAKDISPSTTEWKKLNKEIVSAEQEISKINKRPLGLGQRAGAAGGAFLYGGGLGGGIGSAVGGVAGGLLGGVPGAFAGAAVGQLADNLSRSMAGITSQAAALQQMQRGLAMASIDAKDFAEAQATVGAMSQRLLMPLEQTTRLFTQLRVNTKQYNLSVQETAQIMEGTALAIAATGGKSEDLEGAMRAVVQIFSKGGVQAEELRGQLGERFPGAVVKFAQANRLTFEELQQGLEEGKIGIKEFVEFAKKNYADYSEFSKQLATAPEFAGRRLQKALEILQLEIGKTFGPAGAQIQDFSTQAIKNITQFVVENQALLTQLGKDFATIFSGIASVVIETSKFLIKALSPAFDYIAQLIRQLQVLTGTANAAAARAEMTAASAAMRKNRPGARAYEEGKGNQVRGSMYAKIEYDKAEQRYERAERQFKAAGGYAALPSQATPANQGFTFGGPGAGMPMERTGKRTGGSTKGRESQVPQLQLELELAQKNLEIDERIVNARMAKNIFLENSLETEKGLLELQYKAKAIMVDNIPMAEKMLQIQKLSYDQDKLILENRYKLFAQLIQERNERQQAIEEILTGYEEEVEYNKRYRELLANGIRPELAKAYVEVEKRFGAQQKLLDKEIESLEVGIATAEARLLQLSTLTTLTKIQEKELADLEIKLQKLREELKLRQKIKGQIPSAQDKAKENAAILNKPVAEERINTLKKEIELLRIISDEEARLQELRNEGYTSEEARKIYNLEQVKKNLEDTRRLIDDFVKSTASDYKGFLKAIIQGEDAVDALEQFQKALADRVLTIFLDFSLAPIEQFMQEALRGIFIPKNIPGLEEAGKKEATPVDANTEATNKNTEALNKLTDAINAKGAGDGGEGKRQNENALTSFIDTIRAGASVNMTGVGYGQAMGDTSASFSGISEQISSLIPAQEAYMQSIASTENVFQNATFGIDEQLQMTNNALDSAKEESDKKGADFKESLGKAVGAIGVAAGAIMGIAAGIKQIEKGDTASVIGGIGSILMGLGGGIAGFGKIFGWAGFANGGVTSGGFKAFADGGMVTGPTLGLVGEGKYNEAIVPLPDGRSIPVQLQGESIRDKMSGNGAGGMAMPMLSMSFQSTTINGVEYVDRAQLEAAMAETRKMAVREGATRGASLALDKLANSPSSRRRVGMR